MENTNTILADTGNRYYPLPSEPWKYYQEWDDVIFMHWAFPASDVITMIPKEVSLDVFDGQAYISLVAFSVTGMRFKNSRPLPYLSSFREINLRTYVVKDGIPGIYMLSLETSKWPVAVLSRLLLGLPYKTSDIHRTRRQFKSFNHPAGFSSAFSYKPGEDITEKNSLELWLTERHCLFQDRRSKLFRFDIHHHEWKLQHVKINIRDLQYHHKSFHTVGHRPALQHFSKRIAVLLWGRREL